VQVLGADAIKANPTWANMTAGQVRGTATMRYGTGPVDFGGGGTGAVQVAGPGGPSGPGSLLAPGTAQAPQTGQTTPAQALALFAQYEQRAKAADLSRQIGMPTAEDPAMLRATGQQYLKLALA
jgi:hypothetical protein